MLPPDAGADPEERLLAAVQAFHELILDTEPQQRIMLRLSLEPETTAHDLRCGKAALWAGSRMPWPC